MAIGDVTPKKLYQGALSTTATVVYTAPANVRTQVVEIWLANTNTSTDRKVTLYAHGTGTNNILHPSISVSANDGKIIDSAKIVLAPNETIAIKQDTGTDIIATIYGIEEVIS